MEKMGRKEFLKKAGIAAIGVAAAIPFFGKTSEAVPKNSQVSFKITARPKREGEQ